MDAKLLIRGVDLVHGDPEAKRKEILEYFLKTWEIDELCYKPLKSDDVFYKRGDPLRHIILFYYGHTACFYINKFMIAKIISKRINPEYESIFAIGVDEMNWDDLNNAHYNWPPAEKVREYREAVKKVVIDVIEKTPLQMPITWDSPFWVVMMGCEHSRIHLETSSVLLRQLDINDVVADRFGPICDKQSKEYPANEMISVSGGLVKLGKPRDHMYYGWDNEYGTYSEEVKEFRAAKFLVSNGEFNEFVKAGGYHEQKYWTEEGWKWKEYKKAEFPLFWIKDGDDFRLRLIDREIPMPWNWPVELNYLEAKAFCNWKSEVTGKTIRMPTEAEYTRIRDVTNTPDLPAGPMSPEEIVKNKMPGNINLEQFCSPCPVDMFKNGEFYDVIGNVWQWSETTMAGYDGFRVHPVYDDFTTPTIDGKHNIFNGGSFISTGNEATRHARYAFRRHFYQHAGFRYIESDTPVVQNARVYETDPEVVLSCEFNWGEKFNGEKSFAKELLGKVLDAVKGRTVKKVLDLNSDTGRLPFELAQHFEDVTGLDFSARFIRISIELQEQGRTQYIMKDEGDLVLYREVMLQEYGIEKNLKNILFMQADANNIKPLYTGYDLVVIPNLLEELAYPDRLLSTIHERMNPNSTLVLASTYDWDEKRTPKEHWPGGFKKDGEVLTSFEGIKELLSAHFTLDGEPSDITFTVRKSTRCAEIKKTQVSVWRLK